MVEYPAWCQGVEVRGGAVAPDLVGAAARGGLWQAAPGRLLLDVPGVVRCLVQAGREVIVQPAESGSRSQAARILRLTPFAALLWQRGWLAFRAAAATGPGGAVLFCGDSAVGKSTLLAGLLARGWSLLADDVVPVQVDESGQAWAYPTFPDVRLWAPAALRLGLPVDPDAPASQPLFFGWPEKLAPGPVRVRAVMRLTERPPAAPLKDAAAGRLRFEALGALQYSPTIADALLDRIAYLPAAAAFARSLPMTWLRWPRGKWDMDDLAAQVEAQAA